MVPAMLLEEDVRRLALDVFRRAPEQWRAPEINVRAAQDFAGDDALYVTAVFPDDVSHLSGSHRIDLQLALGDLLMAHGDRRLVYLSTLTRSAADEMKALEAETPSDAA